MDVFSFTSIAPGFLPSLDNGDKCHLCSYCVALDVNNYSKPRSSQWNKREQGRLQGHSSQGQGSIPAGRREILTIKSCTAPRWLHPEPLPFPRRSCLALSTGIGALYSCTPEPLATHYMSIFRSGIRKH